MKTTCEVCRFLAHLGVDKKQIENYHNGLLGVEDFPQPIQESLYRFWSKRNE